MNAKAILLLTVPLLLTDMALAQSPVSFDQKDGRLQIQIDGKPFATYVWRDRDIARPYFAHVHAPNGKPVTHPTRPSRARTPPTTPPCTPASGWRSATSAGPTSGGTRARDARRVRREAEGHQGWRHLRRQESVHVG